MAVYFIIAVDRRLQSTGPSPLEKRLLSAESATAAALLPDNPHFEVWLAQSLHHSPCARQTLCVDMRLLDPCLVLSFGGAGASKHLRDDAEDAQLTDYSCEQAVLAQALLWLDFYTRLSLVRRPRLPA